MPLGFERKFTSYHGTMSPASDPSEHRTPKPTEETQNLYNKYVVLNWSPFFLLWAVSGVKRLPRLPGQHPEYSRKTKLTENA